MQYNVQHTATQTLYVDAMNDQTVASVDAVAGGLWQVTHPARGIATRNSRDSAQQLAEKWLRDAPLTARPANPKHDPTSCINCHERIRTSAGQWLHDSNDSNVCPDWAQNR